MLWTAIELVAIEIWLDGLTPHGVLLLMVVMAIAAYGLFRLVISRIK